MSAAPSTPAPEGIPHPRAGHQIAFVGGIDERFSAVGFAIERLDGFDFPIFDHDAILTVEPGVTDDGDPEFLHPSFEDILGGMGLEDPGRAVGAVDRWRPLAFVAVFLTLLPFPGFRLVVVLVDAVVEIPRDAADGFLAAAVRKAVTTGRKASQRLVR